MVDAARLRNWWDRLPRSRRGRVRLVVVAAFFYLVLAGSTGSFFVPVVLTAGAAVLVGGFAAVAHLLGLDRHHPWAVWLVGRSWREPQRTFRLALQSLRETLTWTPRDRWYGHRHVILQLDAGTFRQLTERLSPGALNRWATEAYADEVHRHSAHLDEPGPVAVEVIPVDGLGRGKWHFTHRLPDGANPSRRHLSPPTGTTVRADARTLRVEPSSRNAELRTVLEEPQRLRPVGAVPTLGIETDGQMRYVRKTPAVLGRGTDADVRLPAIPTVSRKHALLTYRSGKWWIESCGRNGVYLNDIPVTTAAPIEDRDVLRWGRLETSPTSKVRLSA